VAVPGPYGVHNRRTPARDRPGTTAVRRSRPGPPGATTTAPLIVCQGDGTFWHMRAHATGGTVIASADGHPGARGGGV